jgi:hypothetical protein
MRFKIDDLVVMKADVQARRSYEAYKVALIFRDSYLLEHYGSVWEGKITQEDWESEPGSRSWREALIRYQESELFTFEEAVQEQRKLEVEKSRLANEFEAVHAQFRENLDKAADLINQSSTMAEACNKEIRDSLKSDFRNLFHALDRAGWSASFTRC